MLALLQMPPPPDQLTTLGMMFPKGHSGHGYHVEGNLHLSLWPLLPQTRETFGNSTWAHGGLGDTVALKWQSVSSPVPLSSSTVMTPEAEQPTVPLSIHPWWPLCLSRGPARPSTLRGAAEAPRKAAPALGVGPPLPHSGGPSPSIDLQLVCNTVLKLAT